MDKLIALSLFLQAFLQLSAHAYVFERDFSTGQPVRLNVTAENPKVYFRISGSAPAFKNKEKFLDGKYANLDDSNFFKAVVMESMQQWTDVEDSFVEPVLAAQEGPGPNSEDNINNIAIGSGSWSDSGSALPTTGKTDSDSQYIVDCDITLDADTDAERFSLTVLHELGHCLGLLHPHYSTKSVMSYSHASKKFELALDDKAGLTVLYPVSYEKRQNIIPVCGSLAARVQNKKNSLSTVLLLSVPVPLVMGLLLRRRRKTFKIRQ